MKPRKLCANGCGQRVKTAVAIYCSLKCQHALQFSKRVQLLEAGLYRAPQCCSNSFLRRYLVVRDSERCSRCGWVGRNPKTNRITVEVEHIDGDWRNVCPENLVLLCPNWSLTDCDFPSTEQRPRSRREARLTPAPSERQGLAYRIKRKRMRASEGCGDTSESSKIVALPT
jgi:hypothetical protein